MRWTPLHYAVGIALITAPFLTPCKRPAQPAPEDVAAIASLAAHLRKQEGLGASHSDKTWLIHSAGAAASGKGTAHVPILQIGGVTGTGDQDRILAEIARWPDRSRFTAVQVYFYGDAIEPDDPSSKLRNLKRDQKVELEAAPKAAPVKN